MKQDPFHDSYGKGSWERFVLRDTNWCLDRDHCNGGDSNLRVSSCEHCGAKHWGLISTGGDNFLLTEDDGKNCIYNKDGTPWIHKCNLGTNQVFVKEMVYQTELKSLNQFLE